MDIKIITSKSISILKKILLPLEFILSLLLAYSLFRFMILRNYAQVISIKHIIFIMIFGASVISLMIYNFKINREKWEKIIISFLIPLSLIYWMFMIPSHVPDEVSHLWKTYEISEGILVSDKKENTKVPRDLITMLKPNINKYGELNTALYEKTDYNDKVEVNNTAKTYPFFLYIFGAIGFFIARILNLNILVGCYLAQLINTIIFLIAAYYSIKIIPFGKLAITSVIFMPMFLHQATSTSADCIINAIVMFFIAFTIYLIFKEKEINRKEQITFFIFSILLAISKYVYLPIIGLGLILIFTKNMTKKQKVILLTTSIIIATISALAYFVFSNTYESAFTAYFEENNINTSEQIKHIISQPMNFLETLRITFHDRGENYIYEMVGNHLGWLCIQVPNITITAYIVLMIASCFVEENKVTFSTKQKSFNILISIAVILLVIAGLYLTWTTVGANIAEGIQGRYFIPVAFIILLCLCKKQNHIKIKNIQYKLPILLCLLNLSALHAIYKFFR